MSSTVDTARARLRAADPAQSQAPADPQDAAARVMFTRIIGSSEPELARPHPSRRRLVLAGVAAAVVVTMVAMGAVTTPWSHGHPANAAFAVDRRANGSIDVVVRWDQLRDPATLNAQLARLHARTVVIRQSDSCTVDFAFDAARGLPRVDLKKHPELRKPAAFKAWLNAHRPWITYSSDGAHGAVFTIHPNKIPAGDTLLIPFQFGAIEPTTVAARDIIVPKVPRCVPTPEYFVYSDTEIRHR